MIKVKRTMRAAVKRTAQAFLGTFFVLTATVPSAWAGAALSQVQAPGFYRMMLGEFEITALSDGVFDLNTLDMLTNTTPDALQAMLSASHHGVSLPTSVNAFVVNTGTNLILVDTGAAMQFGPTLGKLPANLVASGYRPEQVDAILITHMHPDHVGGLAADGKMLYPNAVVYADVRDADFWLNPQQMLNARPDRKGFFQGAAAAFRPYAEAGRFKAFRGPATLMQGVQALPAPGHTPGHTMYLIESKSEKLMLWGDLMEVASVQFAKPEVAIKFDSDEREAVRQRGKAFVEAAKGRYLVAGAHLPFPGIGHVRSEKNGFTWLPVDYSPQR